MVCSQEMRNNFSILGLLVAMGAIGGGERFSARKITFPHIPLPSDKKEKVRRMPRQGDTASHGAIWRGASSPKRDAANLRAAQMNYKGWCGRPESGALLPF